jgi:pimeloyl-ACP methyl ester carboxylesterase
MSGATSSTAPFDRPHPFEQELVDVGEVRLHVARAGRGGSPLVVLLHGFPEFWWSWRHQLVALAAAGCNVVAPDLRGYHLSDKPRRVSDYGMEHLERDVAGLIRASGAARAVVVGHDWGGALAYSFAEHHPEMVERLAVLNVPHPERLLRGLRTPKQLLKSAYMLYFQLPVLPELALTARDFRGLRGVFEADGRPPEDIAPYVEAARNAGDRLRGGLNYYRASLRDALLGSAPSFEPIRVPTLVIWGQQDRFLGEELAAPDPRLVPNARVERIPAATHWVQQDAPETVNRLLLEFIRQSPPA